MVRTRRISSVLKPSAIGRRTPGNAAEICARAYDNPCVHAKMRSNSNHGRSAERPLFSCLRVFAPSRETGLNRYSSVAENSSSLHQIVMKSVVTSCWFSTTETRVNSSAVTLSTVASVAHDRDVSVAPISLTAAARVSSRLNLSPPETKSVILS